MAKVLKINALSPMQEGMLFHSLYDQEGTNYREQFAFYLEGKIDIEILKLAWQKIIDKHEVFRTDFRWKESKVPIQIVLNEKTMEVYEDDITNLNSDEQVSYIEKFKDIDLHKTMDFEKGRLNRISIIKLREDKFFICWTFHHIILDGWSVPIVINDFINYFVSLQNGEEITSLPYAQYSDYLMWLKKKNRNDALRFWKEYLHDLTNPTFITNKTEGKKDIIKKPEILREYLDESNTKKLNSYCKKNMITPNSIIQVAFGLLLQKYNQTDISCFGMTVSGRPESVANIQESVGNFINTIPVVIKTEEKMSVLDLLKKTSNEMIQAHDYEYMSLVDIKEVSKINNADELFDTLVLYQNYPSGEEMEKNELGLDIKFDSFYELTNFDLTVTVTNNEKMLIEFAYNLANIPHTMAKNMIDQLQNIILAILDNSNLFVNQLMALEDMNVLIVNNKNYKSSLNKKVSSNQNTENKKTEFVAPRTSEEEKIADIWSQILAVSKVGIKDNFFDLGGHSIKAIQIVSRIKRELNIDIKLHELFEYPTIASLMDSRKSDSKHKSVICLHKGSTDKNVFCIHGGGGSVSGFKQLANNLNEYNFYGVQASGLVDAKYLHKNIEEMVCAYLREIQEINKDAPCILMGYSFGSYVAYEIAQTLYLQGKNIERLIILDTPPFNPERTFNPDEKMLEMFIEMISGTGIGAEMVKKIGVDETLRYIYENEKYKNSEPFNQISYANANNIKLVIEADLNIDNKLQMKKSENLFDTDIYYIKAKESELIGDWKEWTRGIVNCYELNGNHGSILEEPDVNVLTEIIEKILK